MKLILEKENILRPSIINGGLCLHHQAIVLEGYLCCFLGRYLWPILYPWDVSVTNWSMIHSLLLS